MDQRPERQLAHRRTGWALVGSGAALALAGTAAVVAMAMRSDPHSWWVPAGRPWPWLVAIGFVDAALGLWFLGRDKALRRDTPHTFLTPPEEQRVLDAIAAFEHRTSGELRVHLSSAHGDVMAAARETFESLGLTQTRERNAVLFFVAVPQRRFAVLGDRGIHERAPERFWEDVAAAVQRHFAQGEFGAGLCEGIGRAGEALATHFPHRTKDVNELPDDISRD